MEQSKKALIVNIRSEQGIVNFKVPLDFDLETDFKDDFSLAFAWSETALIIKRLTEGGEDEDNVTIWSSTEEDLKY